MNEHLNEKLSALIDGELEGTELRQAELHLTECGECRGLLDELRTIARHAGALDDRAPERDLWAGIAARIADEGVPGVVSIEQHRRRFAFSVPQLAAAAVALMALSAGTAAVLMSRATPDVAVAPTRTENLEPRTGIIAVSGPGEAGVATYDAAIRELEATLAARRTRLDTATVRVVEQSLRIIDQAISQARTALDRDTTNLYLNSHLQDALGRKLDLLRHVATLPRMS